MSTDSKYLLQTSTISRYLLCMSTDSAYLSSNINHSSFHLHLLTDLTYSSAHQIVPDIYCVRIDSSGQYSTHTILSVYLLCIQYWLCAIYQSLWFSHQQCYINFFSNLLWTFFIARFRVLIHCFSFVFSGTLFNIMIWHFLSLNSSFLLSLPLTCQITVLFLNVSRHHLIKTTRLMCLCYTYQQKQGQKCFHIFQANLFPSSDLRTGVCCVT